MKQEIYYYNTLEDEVCFDKISEPVIDDKYKYVSHNWFYNFITFIYYRIIIFPIAFAYSKIIKRIKFVNAKAVKSARKTGYFIYANHTNNLSDALTPSVIIPTNKPYVIVNPKNLNVPPFYRSTKMLGALPLPTGLRATKNFMDAVEYRVKSGHGVLIYPEAKIWPYYTGIRPFKQVSFKYPAQMNVPVFTFTTTYQKTKKNKLKMVIYVDGPFCADDNLTVKEKQEVLHDKVYEAMCERAKLSNYEKNKYIKREQEW